MTPACVEHGSPSERGNLLGVQPAVTPPDYRSAQALYNRLDPLFAAAQQRGWLNERTVVVLPEYLGTWLVIAGAFAPALRAPRLDLAARWLIAQHPLAFMHALQHSHSTVRAKESVFRMRGPTMARIYHTVCAQLARTYRVTLVAGSILLPQPFVRMGILYTGAGPLENVTPVYWPDGKADERLVRKIYPTETELPYTRPGALHDLPVFDTPAGRLGVAICADSWYPDVYAALRTQNATLLAVPSYLSGDGSWHIPWGGYNGAATPPDVDEADIGRITEGEAWLKYALTGRAAAAGFTAGINVFLRGALWNLGSDGQTIGVQGTSRQQAPADARAALVTIWL